MKIKDSYQGCPYIRHESKTDDEVDLIEILRALWEKRWLILSFTFIGAIIAGLCVIFIPKSYKAEVVIDSADISAPDTINIAISVDKGEDKMGVSLVEYTHFMKGFLASNEVWSLVIDAIENKDVQNQFWESYKSAESTGGNTNVQTTISNTAFNKKLSILQTGKRKDKVVVSFLGDTSKDAIETLASFLSYVDDYCRSKIMDELKQKIEDERLVINANISYHQIVENQKLDSELSELEKRIASEEKFQRLQLQRQVQYLQEQRALAETLGIVEISSSVQDKPLYALGTKALQAQINMLERKIADNKIASETIDRMQLKMEELKHRRIIGIFDDASQNERERLYWLSKIDLNQLSLNVFQAGKVSVPPKKFQSSPMLIVLLGFILGAMIGILVALVAKFITSQKMAGRQQVL